MAAWVTTADGHHCTRHDTTFARGEVCQRCVTDPPEGEESETPEFDLDLAGRIAEYKSRSKSCWAECKAFLDGDNETSREGNLAVKWSDAAVKWARLAEERQEILNSREHDRYLIAKEREMAGLRGSH